MRVRLLFWALLAAIVTLAPRPASAQDAGAVGLTMGYPGALGIVWQVTDRFAIRPDVSVTRTSSDSTTTATGLFGGAPLSSTNTSEGWGSAVGLSALVTVGSIDRLRLYVTPRVAYSHASSDSETGFDGGLSALTASTKGVIASGSFGAQYNVHYRFALFGELGAQYASLTTRSDFPGSKSKTDSTSLGLRSAVGVAFYF